MSVIDRETFAQYIREYTSGMYRLAFGILHNKEDAEDAVSEAVLKAYEKRNTLRKKESFRAWIMQITANEAKKLYGKNKRTVSVEDMEVYTPVFLDERHELWDACMKLELAYREVILLYYYEQLSLKEIANALHIPEGTVKSRLSRGKKQLRDVL